MCLSLRRAALSEIIDLRHEVLRAGLPREEAIFDGDQSETSRHYGAFNAGGLVGCASVHLNSWEEAAAWQLRGMAVAPAFRRQKVGDGLLRFLEHDIAQGSEVLQLWCNARVPAVPFYQKLGWEVVSEIFHIPTAGPHEKMTRRLSADQGSRVQ